MIHTPPQTYMPLCEGRCLPAIESGQCAGAGVDAARQTGQQQQQQERSTSPTTRQQPGDLHLKSGAAQQQKQYQQQPVEQPWQQQLKLQHNKQPVDDILDKQQQQQAEDHSSTCHDADGSPRIAAGSGGDDSSSGGDQSRDLTPCSSASYSSFCISSTLGSMSMVSISSSMTSSAGSSLSVASSGGTVSCSIGCALAGAGSNCSTSSAWSSGGCIATDDEDSCSTCGTSNSGCAWILSRFGGREVLADYEFGLPLGRGTFGVTRLVTERVSARPFACKTVCKERINNRQYIEDMRCEVQILQHLVGVPGVVQLRGAYEDCRAVNLVLELCAGGDLLDHILRLGRLTETAAAAAARAIVLALQRCHARGVIHRDVKPENFLLATDGCAASCRVSDFGVSAFFQPGQKFREVVGTPYYMAPEVLLRCYDQVRVASTQRPAGRDDCFLSLFPLLTSSLLSFANS